MLILSHRPRTRSRPRSLRPNPKHPLSRGLASHWYFTSPAVGRDIVSGYDALATIGTPTTAWTEKGLALSLNGTTDALSIASVSGLEFTAAYSYACRIYLTSTPAGDATIFSIFLLSGSTFIGTLFDVIHTGYVQILHGQNSTDSAQTVVSSTALSNTTWYDLVVTWDGSNARIYIDGHLDVTSGVISAPVFTGAVAGRIGSYHSDMPSEGNFTPCYLSYFAVYNRALNASEVKWLHDDPFDLFRTGLTTAFLSYGGSSSNAATFTQTGSEAAKFPESSSSSILFAHTGAKKSNFHKSILHSFVLSERAPSRLVRTGANKLQTVLKSGLSRYPNTYCETPDGPILIANGVDPMLVWDPRNRTARPAGMAAPTNAPTVGSSGSGSLSGTYYGYVRWIDADGQVSNLSPVSAAVTVASVSTISYTHTPDNPPPLAAVRRQFLRNTNAEATTWYVDVETTDLTTTGPFYSTLSDTDLSGQEAVPILDADGALFANTHDVPPSHKSVIVAHQNRIFATSEVDYTDGHVNVTAGSTTVTGIGTAWPSNFAGRLLYVVGFAGGAEIASVNTAAQTLTLTAAWSHGTAKYNAYGIRAAPAERRLVYYSASGEPYSWPAVYALSLPDDGDEITGLMVQSSYLFIIKKRRIYRFTFQADPATDGGLFLAAKRGALSNRLVVQTEDGAFMLDELGIHHYSGGDDPEPVSDPIQSIFRDADEDNVLRVNWSADPLYWHASISPVYNVVRFFVAMTGSLYPRHAICYNYRLKRWWLEEYPFPITASTLGRVGEMRALAGAEHRAVVALDAGDTDALSSYVHTHRGTPTAIRPLALIDSTADFATDDSLLNVPVRIASGRGRDQVRRIVGASATRLDIDRPWTVTPGITTDSDPATYQIGGIRWEWVGGKFTIDDTEQGAARDVEIIYKPTTQAAGLDIKLWYNHDANPRNWRMGYKGDGVTIVPGQPHIRVDLTHPDGDVHQRIDGHKEFYAHGDDYVQPGLSGVKGKEPVRIYRLTMAGVGEEG